MAVRIRMKKMGRRHRPFYRICAMDQRQPRGGRVLEELGTYDPNIPDVDARTVLKTDRVDYWIGVGAQPSDKVSVLIKKYGTDGTHVDVARTAREKLAMPVPVPPAPKPVYVPAEPEAEAPAAEPAAEAATSDEAAAAAEESADQVSTAEASTEAVSAEAPVSEAADEEANEAEKPAE
ncbi:MAG: 30S ribosomal protein S16 [Planctomycetales bacterium]|nr:30S ribosomal protein S16 [Planctomycetales bacterium]